MLTGSQSGDHMSKSQARKVCEQAWARGKDTSIASRVGDDQQEGVCWIVATFQGDPTLERLRVSDSHLDFDRGPRMPSEEHRVPASLLGPI